MNKKWIGLGMALLLAVGASGCGQQYSVENAKMYGEGVDSSFETEDMQLETCIMAVGEEEVSLNEMLFYVYELKNLYENSLTDQVWSYKYQEEETVGDYSKEAIIKEIAQVKIICQQAQKEGCELSEEESNEASVLAGKFVEKLPETAGDYHLTRAIVEKIYKEHALAKKMYDVVGGTINTDISQEEIDASDIKDENEAKEAILAERERAAFEEAYAKWKKAYKIVASEKLLEQITLEHR